MSLDADYFKEEEERYDTFNIENNDFSAYWNYTLSPIKIYKKKIKKIPTSLNESNILEFSQAFNEEFSTEIPIFENDNILEKEDDDLKRYFIEKIKPNEKINCLDPCKKTKNISNLNTSLIKTTGQTQTSRNLIFLIKKIPHEKNNNEKNNKNKSQTRHWKKNLGIDWNEIFVPKEKHFHFDRKKHRIVFQRKHLKIIYSIVDLPSPFDFLDCYQKIREHVGEKTVKNYGKGKSFHLIKNKDGEIIIVTLREKKRLLKGIKISKD